MPVGQGGMRDPVLGTEQALLFAVKKRQQNRPSRRLGKQSGSTGQGEQPGRATGVVVRAVVDLADRSPAVARAAITDMVVVCADDDHLILQFRIAALNQGQDVTVVWSEHLDIAAVGPRFAKADLGKVRDQVIAGRPPAGASCFTSFSRIIGQIIDVGLESLGADRFHRHTDRGETVRRQTDGGPRQTKQEGQNASPAQMTMQTRHGRSLKMGGRGTRIRVWGP